MTCKSILIQFNFDEPLSCKRLALCVLGFVLETLPVGAIARACLAKRHVQFGYYHQCIV